MELDERAREIIRRAIASWEVQGWLADAGVPCNHPRGCALKDPQGWDDRDLCACADLFSEVCLRVIARRARFSSDDGRAVNHAKAIARSVLVDEGREALVDPDRKRTTGDDSPHVVHQARITPSRKEVAEFKATLRRSRLGAESVDEWLDRLPTRHRDAFRRLVKRDQDRIVSRFFDGIEPKGTERDQVNRLVRWLCQTRLDSLNRLTDIAADDEGDEHADIALPPSTRWLSTRYFTGSPYEALMMEVFTSESPWVERFDSRIDPADIDRVDAVRYCCPGCHPYPARVM